MFQQLVFFFVLCYCVKGYMLCINVCCLSLLGCVITITTRKRALPRVSLLNTFSHPAESFFIYSKFDFPYLYECVKWTVEVRDEEIIRFPWDTILIARVDFLFNLD